MPWKGWSRKKRVKLKLKVKSEQRKLTHRAKERPPVPIEEIRRKGLIMASQGFGQGIRLRPPSKVNRS